MYKSFPSITAASGLALGFLMLESRASTMKFVISTIENQRISFASSIKNYQKEMNTFEASSARDIFLVNRCATFVAILVAPN